MGRVVFQSSFGGRNRGLPPWKPVNLACGAEIIFGKSVPSRFSYLRLIPSHGKLPFKPRSSELSFAEAWISIIVLRVKWIFDCLVGRRRFSASKEKGWFFELLQRGEPAYLSKSIRHILNSRINRVVVTK